MTQPSHLTDANGVTTGAISCTIAGPRVVTASIASDGFSATLPVNGNVTFLRLLR